jgi:hypothetical protein
MRVFWWVLLVIATAVVIGMTGLILFADAGNWFTVVGGWCTMTVSMIQLRALKQRDA